MKTLITTNTKQSILVDDTDYALLSSINWYHNPRTGYVYGWNSNTKRPVQLHYWLLERVSGLECDHIDRNKLNNQRQNLRMVPHHINQLNREAPRGEDMRNIYERPFGWQVNMKRRGLQITVGTYDSYAEALLARDVWLANNPEGSFATRDPYLTGDAKLAASRGYDIAQLKLDGWWCEAIAAHGEFTYYSETGREFARSSSFGLDGCTIRGEFMRGTQWSQHPDRKGRFYLYDITKIHGEEFTTEPYATRYRALRKLKLPECFTPVASYPISNSDALWNRFVLNEGYEGLVFRRSSAPLGDAIFRCKREYTLDGIVTAFIPGKGKYEGSLGAVTATLPNGNTTDVGGGFTDAERHAIWSNQPTYLGRVMEFTANAIFESGAPRHPRFVRWRNDKS